VGVRVRPFLPRVETSDKLCVQMDGNTVTVKDELDSNEAKAYAVDHAFWSHDGYDTSNEGLHAPEKDPEEESKDSEYSD
jgi:hypothetical protein